MQETYIQVFRYNLQEKNFRLNFERKYDKTKKLVLEKEMSPKGSILSETHYQYHENDLSISGNKKFYNSEDIMLLNYKFNNKGNLIYKQEGMVHTIEYDINQNIIKEEKYVNNSNLREIRVITINYSNQKV